MDTMNLTAKVLGTDREVTVAPMAVFGYCDDFSTIRVVDTDARGLWYGSDFEWHIDIENGDTDDAERITGIFGDDDEEWEASANKKLADYGLRLGDFDETRGDRYALIAL